MPGARTLTALSEKGFAMTRKRSLAERFPPSPPCTCEKCLGYCSRPGWWTVAEAERALAAGLGARMMLEMAPGFSFGVLAPAFRGNEGFFALNLHSTGGCTFLRDGLCELHGSGLEPLECRFCHHDRPGQGEKCHTEIEKDWNSAAGQALVERWCAQVNLVGRLGMLRLAQGVAREQS